MIEEYIQRLQEGKIDFLEFLLSQSNLSEMYLKEMLDKGITPTSQNAEEWMMRYENQFLYNAQLP